MKEQGELMDLLSTLQLNELKDDELIWVSTLGGESGVSNSVSGCGPSNNCNGGNCISGCSSSK